MKKNMTRLIAAMMILTMVLVSAGCGNSEPENRPYNYNLEEYVTVGEYMGLEYTAFEVEVTDKEVEDTIEEILAQYMTKEEVTEGTVKSGDYVGIKYSMEVEGEEVTGTDTQVYTVKVGDSGLMPEVDKALIGAEVGETIRVETTFAEDYDLNPEYAGKAVKYEITVENIAVPVYQELTDEFAKKTLGMKDAADYREMVKETLYQNKLADARYAAGEEIWAQVVEASEVIQYPEGDVAKTEEKLTESLQTMAEQSGMNLEDGIAAVLGLDEETFKEGIHKSAEVSVKEELILYTIAREHDLEMTEKEIQDYLDLLLAANNVDEDDFEAQYGMDIRTYAEDNGVLISLLYEEVFGFLVDNGTAK